ncbi:hypothetical protein MTR67_049313 [Solanum verrucosum]|uniref:Uncharacterized protein n=1 Tax=Solanum verrucosum TaxID=315347 RepID=A0AAF0UZG7_SOLVR|nr:hypothetical protein MTR67_049313 [Solanum verrucosum]
MGRKALRKKVNCLIDNDDMVPPENSRIAPVKENLPTQHVEELIYRGNVDTLSEVEINYYYGGYFIFSPSRKYVNGHLKKTNMDIDFVSYFNLLDDLKKHCKFDIFEGDKKIYLRGDRVINDYVGLVEYGDDSDVRNMMVSYKMHKKKLIEIFTLSKNYNIVMNTSLGEHDARDNTSEEVNEVSMEEHELANSVGNFYFFIFFIFINILT